MEKRMNKKAQDLSIGTLILIVLGIVVLVLLILGFSLGWGNLWEKINIFGGGSSLGDVSQACALAVTSNNIYDYCSNFKEVTVNGKSEYVNCEDERVKQGFEGRITCNPQSVKQAKEALCVKLKEQGDADTRINNEESCQGVVADNCIPDDTECFRITGDDIDAQCEDACAIIDEEAETGSSQVCKLADNAVETCKAKNDNKQECIDLTGCKYIGA